MFSKLRNAFVGLLVIAASTVAVTVSDSPVSAAGAVAPSAATSNPSIGVQTVPTWTNTNVIAVDTGYEGACAIQGSSPSATSGSLFCWGKAAILGTGANTSSNVPVAVSATDGFTNLAVTSVTVGSDHACAIEDGKLWCWGGNFVNGTYGVLGTGGVNSLTPKAVSTSSVAGFDNDGANGDAVIAVDAAYSFTCAVEGVEVYCWGNNSNSNLGLGANASSVVNRPMRVLDTATPGFQAASATAVQVGFYHACALASGSAYCWGFNNEGRLGNTTPATGLPTAVATGDFTGSNSNLTAIGLGNYHSCGVQSGKLRCWGEGTYNQLGTGNTSNAATPTNVSAAGSFTNNGLVTSVSGSEKHTCAIQSGVLYCWGKNAEGQLGLGNTTDSSTALPVSASDVPGFLNNGNVTAVSANSGGGYSQTCAIESGTVYCWGASSEGRLGLGTVYGNQSKPVKVFVVSAPAAPTISVSAGQSGSLNVGVSKPNDGGSTITSYEYSVDNGTPVSVVFGGSNYQTITISNLANGTSYSIKVRAVNAVSNGSWSAPSSGTPTAGGGNNGGNNGGGNCTGGASIMPSSTSGVGTVGTPMSLNGPVPSGFMGTPTFTISSVPLPAGLTLNPQTGLVAGTPTATSFASVIINVVNGAKSCQYNITFSITPSGGGGGMPTCTTGAPGVRGTNPTLDSTFGTGGAISFTLSGGSSTVRSGVATNDGNIVIAESPYTSAASSIKLRKYTPSGVLVPGFGTDGVLTIDKVVGTSVENVYAMSELSDGSLALLYTISATPRENFVAKVTAAGVLDTSWATSGFVSVGTGTSLYAREMKVLSDNSMIVYKSRTSGSAMINELVKVLANGTLDSSFGTSGTLTLAESEFNFNVTASGSIIVGGDNSATPTDATIRKFSSAGVLDTSWATGGILTLARIGSQGDDNSTFDVAVDSSGRLYAAVMTSSMQSQSSTTKLLRLLADGSLDSSFGGGAVLPSSIMNVDDILVLRDGNILVTAMSGMYSPKMGVALVSADGVLGSAFANEFSLMQFGDCALSDMTIAQATTGEVLGFGSIFGMNTSGSLWKLIFSGVTNTPTAGGSTPGSGSTAGSGSSTESSTPAPTLVTTENAAALVRTPGSQSIIINGEEVVIESNTVSIPAARTPADYRTPAQVASIQQAGAALLQQFLASLPAGATSNVVVVNTATGAVMQNLVFDANGNSVNVPVEDIVFLDGPQLSLMIGSNNANITADGKYQVGAGGIVGVTGAGLGAGANGEIIAMSTPTLLANFQTTAAGDFNKSATLPDSIGVGDHTLVVATGTTYAMMGIRVVPAALPTTGGSSERVIIIALFTLVFGALFFRGRRISLI